ncbi:MAG: helix-turn-helix domain-containing protein [Gammaproteobacteria bacterium]
MGRTLNQKISQLPCKRQKRVKKRAAELINEELSLRDLRKALDLTQTDIADRLGVGQDAVSRYEQRTDMLLSTLHGYLQAMGGRLTILAEFPNRKPVRISHLKDIETTGGDSGGMD